jgi:hypothetical protein
MLQFHAVYIPFDDAKPLFGPLTPICRLSHLSQNMVLLNRTCRSSHCSHLEHCRHEAATAYEMPLAQRLMTSCWQSRKSGFMASPRLVSLLSASRPCRLHARITSPQTSQRPSRSSGSMSRLATTMRLRSSGTCVWIRRGRAPNRVGSLQHGRGIRTNHGCTQRTAGVMGVGVAVFPRQCIVAILEMNEVSQK